MRTLKDVRSRASLRLDRRWEGLTRSKRLLALLLGCGLAAALVGAPGALAAKCFGHEATIVGTSGPDQIVGTAGRDVIVGDRGHDVIRGL
jgi:Ca2+-binding RTX toxin-like protein